MSEGRDRLEVRIAPEFRDLVDAIRRVSGDSTDASLTRRLFIAHGRELAKSHPAVRRALARVDEGAS